MTDSGAFLPPCSTLPEARATIGKICGQLGSENVNERSVALGLLGPALRKAGFTWGWLSDVVARGEIPGGDRGKIFHGLVLDRLNDGLKYAWAMSPSGAYFVRHLLQAADLSSTAPDAIREAFSICDEAKRRADVPDRGPGRKKI